MFLSPKVLAHAAFLFFCENSLLATLAVHCGIAKGNLALVQIKQTPKGGGAPKGNSSKMTGVLSASRCVSSRTYAKHQGSLPRSAGIWTIDAWQRASKRNLTNRLQGNLYPNTNFLRERCLSLPTLRLFSLTFFQVGLVHPSGVDPSDHQSVVDFKAQHAEPQEPALRPLERRLTTLTSCGVRSQWRGEPEDGRPGIAGYPGNQPSAIQVQPEVTLHPCLGPKERFHWLTPKYNIWFTFGCLMLNSD